MAAEIAVLKAGYVFMHFGQKGRKAIAARPQDSGPEKDPDYAFPASDPRISGQEFKFTFTRRIAGGGAGVVKKTKKKKRAPVNAEAAPDEQEEDPFESLDTASEDELDAAEEQIARASEDEEDLEGEDAEEPESEEDAGDDDDDEEEEDPLAGLM